MTVSPEQQTHGDPAWWVATVQGGVLAGPFPDEASAREVTTRVAVRPRESMRRERHGEADIAERLRALRVGYEVTVHPHGGFEARPGD